MKILGDMSILNALKGIGGEFEITRVIGAIGAMTYIISAPTFVAWEILYNHRQFDIVSWCTFFPAGLVAVLGAIAGAAAIKDRNVATAQVVRETGSQPGAAAGTSGVQNVKVINKPQDAVPVDQAT